MKKYLVTNIDWDCDDENVKESLPLNMIVEDKNDLTNEDYQLSDFISDEISNIVEFTHFGCDYTQIVEREDIVSKLSQMEKGNIFTLYAVETQIKGSEPLAMGVEKHQVLDGVIVFLCNVWGSNVDFQSIPLDDSDIPEEEVYNKVADYFFNTAKNLCGRHKFVLTF